MRGSSSKARHALSQQLTSLLHFSHVSCVCRVSVLQSGPKASLYLTLVGILAGFMSTFWNLGYQRTSARMQVTRQQLLGGGGGRGSGVRGLPEIH